MSIAERLLLSARIASLAVVLASTAAAQQLYWTDAQIGSFAIRHANLDGTGIQTVVAYAAHPRGLAIDASQGQMYWNDLGTLNIRRADLDGSNAVDITAISNAASGIALDVYAGKIYWTDAGSGSISRCNLNGSSVQALISSGLPYPTAIALNLQAGKMYWTDIVAMKIQRANLDGSSIEDVVINMPGPANGVALDVAAGSMYWSDTSWTNGAIRKANLDGGNAITILSGLESPTTIALDHWHGKVYWTQTLTTGVAPGIYRANLDGSGPESIVTSYGTPWGLAGGSAGAPCGAGRARFQLDTPSRAPSALDLRLRQR